MTIISSLRNISDRLGNFLGYTSATLQLKYKRLPDVSRDFLKFVVATKRIPGMITLAQAKNLYFLSATQSVEGDVLEIGSWLGKSTIFLAYGCSVSGNGKVVAVDTFKGNPGKEEMYTGPLVQGESIYSRFVKNIESMGLQDFVKPFKGTSKAASMNLIEKYRLVYIDACHEYKSVLSDIDLWQKKLLKGGFIVFDDYNSDFPGNVRAISEKIIESKSYKVVYVGDSQLVAVKIS